MRITVNTAKELHIVNHNYLSNFIHTSGGSCKALSIQWSQGSVSCSGTLHLQTLKLNLQHDCFTTVHFQMFSIVKIIHTEATIFITLNGMILFMLWIL